MSDSSESLYRAEYAKSGRSNCKGCKSQIEKDSLRLAVMVQSPFFDGKTPNWYHFKCFFLKQRVKTPADIAHYESLRFDDQQRINASIKKANGNSKDGNAKLDDFLIEYSKSGGAKCQLCEEKITKGVVRVAKKIYDSERALTYGSYYGQHHLECFVKRRVELQWFLCGSKLPGFKSLNVDDMSVVKETIPKIAKGSDSNNEAIAGTSNDKDDDTNCVKSDDKALLKRQNKQLFAYRDKLEQNLTMNDLKLLCSNNDQYPTSKPSQILDFLADVMTFGALLPCSVCKEGQYVFSSGVGYQCTGHLTGWTPCMNVESNPKRRIFNIPKELKDKHDFLNRYKCTLGDRIMANLGKKTIRDIPKKRGTKQIEEVSLKDMSFVIGPNVDQSVEVSIKKLNGRVSKRVTKKTLAFISTQDFFDSNHSTIMTATRNSVNIILPEVVNMFTLGNVFHIIQTNSLNTVEKTIEERLGNSEKVLLNSNSCSNKRVKLESDSVESNIRTVRLKGAVEVDTASNLDDVCHVYCKGDEYYSTVMSKTDLSSGKNSFYKMQLLKHDTCSSYWVFRSWGRLGTSIGSSSTNEYDTLSEAKEFFEMNYFDKTGNCWADRKQFVKMPCKFYPMDLDEHNSQNTEYLNKLSVDKSNSTLETCVQKLICLIFDTEIMNKTLLEFRIDIQKLPLGKISKKQMESAYEVLTEAQDLVQKQTEDKDSQIKPIHFVDCSNRFFTLVPHIFATSKIPVLDNLSLIKEKIELVSSLLEMEIAYSIMHSAQSAGDNSVNLIDAHYNSLKSDISQLQKSDDMHNLLCKYLLNTHAPTHTDYKLEIVDIFRIRRNGEDMRFKPFEALHNHKLLWHGSRLTNFAGILSQGLRIAPESAPVSGYMFGKGIYFADMVSKSANYCFATPEQPYGLLLLCDVALGNMHELKNSKYIRKLPSDKHSTKGIGQTQPNTKSVHTLAGGVEVPFGKPSAVKVKSSLLYNEYIIYDEAQCKIEYLFYVKFKF